jgi:hypothetical protein
MARTGIALCGLPRPKLHGHGPDPRAAKNVGRAAGSGAGPGEGHRGTAGEGARGSPGGSDGVGTNAGPDDLRRLGIQGSRHGRILGDLQHGTSIEAFRPPRDRVAEARIPGTAAQPRRRRLFERCREGPIRLRQGTRTCPLAGAQQTEEADPRQAEWDPIVPGTRSESIFHRTCGAGSAGARP